MAMARHLGGWRDDESGLVLEAGARGFREIPDKNISIGLAKIGSNAAAHIAKSDNADRRPVHLSLLFFNAAKRIYAADRRRISSIVMTLSRSPSP